MVVNPVVSESLHDAFRDSFSFFTKESLVFSCLTKWQFFTEIQEIFYAIYQPLQTRLYMGRSLVQSE